MRSAILFRMFARSVGEVLPHASLRLVGGIEREFDVLRGRTRDLAERLAGDRRDIVEVLSLDRRDPLAADEVVILRADCEFLIELIKSLMDHFFPLCRFTACA